jgi:hypothetical protein
MLWLKLALACQFEPGHQYAGRDVLLNVTLSNGVATAHNADAIIWKERGIQMVTQLARVADKLPDANLLVNLHDGPGVLPTARKCGVSAVYAYAVAPVRGIRQFHLPIMLSDHNPLCSGGCGPECCPPSGEPRWSEKRHVAVWRGAPTDGSRDTANLRMRWRKSRAMRMRAVMLSHAHPEAIDAHFTEHNVSLAAGATVLDRASNRMAFNAFFDHRYVLDLDGAGGSFRLPSLLMSQSIVVRPEIYTYWFSEAFKGAYAAVDPTLSDLVLTLQRFEANATLLNAHRAALRTVQESRPFSREAQLKSWLASLPVYLNGLGM